MDKFSSIPKSIKEYINENPHGAETRNQLSDFALQTFMVDSPSMTILICDYVDYAQPTMTIWGVYE